MNLLNVILALLVNKLALQYAICAALVLSPLYAFVLKPILRWSRHHACAAATMPSTAPVHAARELDITPVRLSTASSKGFLSPNSLSATPLQVTPVFNASSRAPGARVSGGASASPARSPSADVTAPPQLEVVGTAIHASAAPPAVQYRSPASRFVSALRRQAQQRGAAVLGGDADEALRRAVDAGEVYQHHATLRLPSQDHLALRLLRRQQQHALYDQLDITEASLDALYASPKFQEWYGANRAELLREQQLRESFYQWRSLARAAVLLVALLLLPAFSFSTETNAVQWQASLTSASTAPAVEAAPFAQILLTRMHFIQSTRPAEAFASRVLPFASHMRADLRTFVATAVSMAEWLAIVAAVCSLVTSCFMPRGSRRAASVALGAFLVVLIESLLVPGVSMKLGLGSLLVVTVVAAQIRRAAE